MSEAALRNKRSVWLQLVCAGVKSEAFPPGVGGWGNTKPSAVLGAVVPRLSLSPLAVLALSSLSCLWLTQNLSDILK